VAPLMDSVPGSLMTDLTSAACFHPDDTGDYGSVHGGSGLCRGGKTTQFRAVTGAISLLPEATRPRVIGLGPTHPRRGGNAERRRGCADYRLVPA
jgi:hypothetical protein